jgi:poly(3-hydroxybutyrate) depolymerase
MKFDTRSQMQAPSVAVFALLVLAACAPEASQALREASLATPPPKPAVATEHVAAPAAGQRAPGCAKPARPAGERAITVDGMEARYIVAVPPSYAVDQPTPLVFAFHGRNRTHQDCRDTDCRGIRAEIEPRALVVYMKSLGGTGWEGPAEREHNVRFFDEVLADIESAYCVDTTRVIATGTSSGAFFTNVLGCRHGDLLRAVVPVSGGMPEKDACKGQPIAVVVHGVDDSHVRPELGVEAREAYRARNHCGVATSRPIEVLHQSVVTARESHACLEYGGCDNGHGVGWCEHSEGGYDGSTHGWPKFGGTIVGAVLDLVSGVRPTLVP